MSREAHTQKTLSLAWYIAPMCYMKEAKLSYFQKYLIGTEIIAEPAIVVYFFVNKVAY